MTSIYNKYIDSNAEYHRIYPEPERTKSTSSLLSKLNLSSVLSGILPDWLDPSDAVLLLMLLLLYMESEDEDFLIILAVIAYSIFKKDD